MKRFTRQATLAVGTLALVGGLTPPAQAISVLEVTFIGTATVIGGLGYPVLTLPAPTGAPTMSCLPLPGQITQDPANCHPVYDHQRAVGFFSNVCTAEETNVNKPGKAPEIVAACAFSAVGTVTGHCGATGGQVSGTINFATLPTTLTPQTYDFDAHFTGVGGEFVFSGHTRKRTTGQTGLIVAEGDAVPDVLGTTGQSCTNKTQQHFIIVGEANAAVS